MNKERLRIARDYLANEVNPKMFKMLKYREGGLKTPECNSVGNALGHLTVLDEKFKTDPDYCRFKYGEIDFLDWGRHYFQLSWEEIDFVNNVGFYMDFPDYTNKQQLDHTVERIDYLIKYGRVPEGFTGVYDCKDFPLGFFKGKNDMLQAIKEMHRKFRITHELKKYTDEEKAFRVAGIREELQEYINAKTNADKLDALIDLSIFVFTAVEREGFLDVFETGYNRVMGANMKKRLGGNAKRGDFKLDLVKPDDWKPADLNDLVE